MTRKIPKLREKHWTVEETVESPAPEIEQKPEPIFPEAMNDATLEKLVRVRAFEALKAKMVACYGSVPDEIRDEMQEMERSL